MPTFLDIATVNTPADKKPGRSFIEGTLYDFHGHTYNNYHHLAVCANCDKILMVHVDKKCPFEASEFKYVYDPNYKFDIRDKMEFEREQEYAKQVQKSVGTAEEE